MTDEKKDINPVRNKSLKTITDQSMDRISNGVKQPSGESESLSPEQKVEFFQEGRKELIMKEQTKEESITKEALKREIDTMELNDSLKKEAYEKAKKIQTLGQEEKIEHLLEDAKVKGIVFSIKVAQQINDPYVLDTFHDILVKNWADYKQFLR